MSAIAGSVATDDNAALDKRSNACIPFRLNIFGFPAQTANPVIDVTLRTVFYMISVGRVRARIAGGYFKDRDA